MYHSIFEFSPSGLAPLLQCLIWIPWLTRTNRLEPMVAPLAAAASDFDCDFDFDYDASTTTTRIRLRRAQAADCVATISQQQQQQQHACAGQSSFERGLAAGARPDAWPICTRRCCWPSTTIPIGPIDVTQLPDRRHCVKGKHGRPFECAAGPQVAGGLEHKRPKWRHSGPPRPMQGLPPNGARTGSHLLGRRAKVAGPALLARPGAREWQS